MSKKNKNFKKNKYYKSSSRHRRKKPRKRDIKIRSKSQNRRKRERMKNKRKTYQRRRITLLVLFLFLITFIISKAISYFNRYELLGYPPFRDDVLSFISENVLISDTENRDLTKAEKLEDFDKLNEYVVRNYAIDKDNEKAYLDFVDKSDEFRKNVSKSESDQEFFDLLSSYLEILDDNRTHIISRKTYDMLFDYYKEDKKSPRAKILGDSQVVNRYKRLVGKKSNKSSLSISENENTLEIKLKSFNLSFINEDMKKIKDKLSKDYSNVIIDLSNNESLDDKYANKLLSLLIHEDYYKEKLVFYRGNLLKESLSFMKENKDKLDISSSFVKNPAFKYPKNLDYIDKNHYTYYDQINIDIKKDMDISNKNIYILTNSKTKNDPIRFAKILKDKSDAYIIKNSNEGFNKKNDRVEYLRPSIFKLDHSGILLSINNSYNLNENDTYIDYDQEVNTDDPLKILYENIK